MDNNIIIGDFSNEMSTRYLSYAMDVIVNRALPDIRDGLKPVHRRILYDMFQLGLMPNKSYKKSARVVGDVLGKYHPHGDSSVYDALVKLAQNFRMRYPLVDGHGNFGSVDGDSAAAMRYTETKLKPIALEMLNGTNENIVKFVPNFDGEETEPTVLPTKFPNLLVNGSSGIAVGMTTEIPPHNLTEVIDSIIYKIKNPGCNLTDIMQFVKSPDFPTGATILNQNDLYNMYKTGKGKIIIRAKYHIENTKKYKQIVFTEIPYNTIKSKIVENIATLTIEKDKVLQNIVEIRDESDRNGIRIVIDLRKNQDENIILKQLFIKTQLQKNFNAIFCALVNNEPKVLPLLDILEYYIDFQKEIIINKSTFELQIKEKRLNVLQGLKIAINDIDKVINIIKTSENRKNATNNLQHKLELNKIQTNAILDLKLERLTKLNKNKINEELISIKKEINRLKLIIKNNDALEENLINQLIEMKSKFGDKRRTTIIEKDKLESIDTNIIEEYSTYCTISKHGYLHKLRKKSDSIKLKDEDYIINELYSNNADTLLLFSNRGNCYKLYEYELDEDKPSKLGQYLPSLLNMGKNEEIITMVTTNNYVGDIIEIFENGKIARIPLESFKTKTKRTKLKNSLYLDNGKLINLFVINKDSDILLQTSINKILITNTSIINSKKSKNTSGVQIMKMKSDSKIIRGNLLEQIDTNKINNIKYYKNNTGKGTGKFLKKYDVIDLS